MKKLILIISIFTTLSATAGVITCSNNPSSPGQYAIIQDAIDNSTSGDTILVHGSTTGYAAFTSYWQLTFIGAGYNNPNGENSTINSGGNIEFRRLNGLIGASGSSLIGFDIHGGVRVSFYSNFSGGTAANQLLENIVIERNKIGAGSSGILLNDPYGNYRDLFFRNNIFFGVISTGQEVTIDNMVFENNYFEHIISMPTTHTTNTSFVNNVFYNATGAELFSFCDSLHFANNIFWDSEPQGCEDCIFDNNITYFNVNDNLIDPGNPGASGGGNLIGQDPMFVTFPLGGSTFSYANDYHLQSSSPAIGSGFSGTDMGIYGGVSPFEVGANPAIPQMEEITTPLGSTVSQGTNLNVTFKSYKQD
jgi:hypothetical protein